MEFLSTKKPGGAKSDCLVSADEKLVKQLTTGSPKLIAFNVRVPDDVEKMFQSILN